MMCAACSITRYFRSRVVRWPGSEIRTVINSTFLRLHFTTFFGIKTMINVGVIGLGMMGLTHLDVYVGSKNAKVVAVADADPNRLSGKVQARGNVDGQAQGKFDVTKVKGYTDALALINDPQVQMIDVCLPTPLHKKFGIAVLEAGKHLLMEKPLARTSADAYALVDAAEIAFKKSGALAMPAMCMRFWPGWNW